MKVKRIVISPSALVKIMSQNTAWRVKKGIPSTARFVGATIDPYANVYNLFVEDKSFDEVPENSVAPILETEFHKID